MKKVLALAVLFCASAFAQTGFPPFGSFDEGTNRANLNANFSIPIMSANGRGFGMSLALVNNSIIWSKNTAGTAWTPSVDAFGNANWGWTTTSPFGAIKAKLYTTNCRDGGHNYPIYHYDTYSFIDGAGTKHAFSVTMTDGTSGDGICAGSITGTWTGYATDNSGYYIDINDPYNPIVYTSSGMKMTTNLTDTVGVGDIDKITDPNGNYVTRSTSTVGTTKTTTWYDTLNRSVLTMTDTRASDNKVTYSILSNSTTNETIVATYSSQTISTGFSCSGVSDYGGSASLPASIVVDPSGSHTQTYSISYDSAGRVSDVTLPTGGHYKYAYTKTGVTNNGINCSDGTYTYQKRTINDGSDHDWEFSRNTSTRVTTVTPPSVSPDTGAHQKYSFDTSWRETQAKFFQDAAETVTMRTLDTTWGTYGPSNVKVTLDNNKQSQVATTYDSYLRLTQKDEYAFGSGAVGSVVRKTTIAYLSGSNYTSRNILSRVTQQTVKDGSNVTVAQTTMAYDGSTPSSVTGAAHHDDTNYGTTMNYRGNLTSTTQWSNGGTDPVTTYAYNTLGMVTSITDPGSHVTTISYTDHFSDGLSHGSTYAFPYQVTNAASQVTTNTYFWPSGLIQDVQDPNSRHTSYTYDVLLRPASISYPDGGSMTTTITESSRQVQVQTLLTTSPSTLNKNVYSQVDVLGRASRTAAYNGSNYEQQDTCYDAQGRVAAVSAPYQSTGFGATIRCGASFTDGGTTTYDGLGRVVTATATDGTNSRTTTTTYRGTSVKVSDPSGIAKTNQYDALGNLLWVCEVTSSSTTLKDSSPENTAALCGSDLSSDPYGFQTSYSYNTLGQLTQVTQPGLNNRTYTYNALGRLTQTVTPESGQTDFTYTTEGLASTRVRHAPNKTAGNVTTTYSFDSLHRPTQTSYSDGTTPQVNISYDSAPTGWSGLTNIIGRATKITNGSGNATSVFSYDSMGRAVDGWYCTPSTTTCDSSGSRHMVYEYDLAGDLKTFNNSQWTMSYVVDVLQRMSTATSSWSDSTHPATMYSSPSFGRFGVSQYTVGASIGNGVQTAFSYNSFGQLSSKSATNSNGSGTLVFSMTSLGYNPNGSLNASTVNSSIWSYTYDEFMRLNQATQTGYNPFNYDYDRYGNRWDQLQTGGSTVYTPADGATNQIATGNGVTYDDLSNITNDGVHTYAYDAENRLITVDPGLTPTAIYKYDAASLRVQKTVGITSLDYYYDPSGNVSAAYNGSTFVRGEVFIGSHIATYSGGHTYFHHTNWLGSESTRTDESGTKVQDCEWYSFGELNACTTNTDPYAYTPYGYAGYERDSETGLDHMQFRYYNSRIGRFLNADLMDGSPLTPQSFNRMGYVNNAPVLTTDVKGLCPKDFIQGHCGEPVEGCALDSICSGTGWFDVTGSLRDFLPLNTWGNLDRFDRGSRSTPSGLGDCALFGFMSNRSSCFGNLGYSGLGNFFRDSVEKLRNGGKNNYEFEFDPSMEGACNGNTITFNLSLTFIGPPGIDPPQDQTLPIYLIFGQKNGKGGPWYVVGPTHVDSDTYMNGIPNTPSIHNLRITTHVDIQLSAPTGGTSGGAYVWDFFWQIRPFGKTPEDSQNQGRYTCPIP